MGNIYEAQVPEARWAGPEDSLWDKHYNKFELWVNDLYERREHYDLGFYGEFGDALESQFLFDIYMDEHNRSKEE